MTTTAQQVLTEALELSPVDRAELIERLFQSFDPADPRSVDTAWANEIESRFEAYDKGCMDASPAADVMNRINCR